MFKMTRNLKQSNHRDRQRRECTGDITHQYNVFEKAKTHTHFSLKYPVIPYIAHCTRNKNCIQGNICPVLFSPLSPLMSVGELKIGRTSMSHYLSINTTLSGRIQDCLQVLREKNYMGQKQPCIKNVYTNGIGKSCKSRRNHAVHDFVGCF